MAAVIFQGSAVKALKDILRMKTGTELITGDSDDPTVVAKDAPIGSKYLRAGTSEIYTKLDSGSSTNWDIDSSDINRLVKLGLSTGLIDGGVVTVNGGDPTLFDVEAGSGVVVDTTTPTSPVVTFVSWSASTGNSVTNLATQDQTAVGINAAGSVVQYVPISESGNHAQRRDSIQLSLLLHFSRAKIDDVIDAPAVFIQSSAIDLADISTALGPVNRTGNNYTDAGLNNLQIVKNTGEFYVTGVNYRNNTKNPNYIAFPAKAAADTFTYVWRDGSGGWSVAIRDTIDPTRYDDGTGGVGVPNGTVQSTYYSNQRIYLAYDGAHYVLYSQQEYETRSQALNGIFSDPYEVPPFLASVAAFRTVLTVRQDVTDLGIVSRSVFTQLGKLGDAAISSVTSAVTTLQQAYDNSSFGEVVVNSTKGAQKVRDNSTPTGGTLLEVTDNVGTTPYFTVSAVAVNASGLLKVDNLQLDGNTLSSVNTDGNLELTPDGVGTINANKNLILAADATLPLQATTKQQLDAAINGVQRKQSVRSATTANITLSGEQTIDGVALVTGDRCLVKAQTTQTENGIYVIDTGAWTRSADANSSAELNHAITSIESGSTFADTAWEQTTDTPNIGVDNIVWVQAYGVGTFTASELGIKLVGSQFQLDIDGTTLSQSASGVKVADLGIADGQISNSAAITLSKLAALTVDRAVQTNSSGILEESSVTSTELGFVSGVTSGIQTQLDAKQARSTLTTKGDLYVRDASDVVREAVGTDTQVLQADATTGSGIVWTSRADIIYPIINISGTTSLTNERTHLVDTSSTAAILTLPAPALNAYVRVKDKSGNAVANTITVNPNVAETIDGAASLVINSNYGAAVLVSDGTDWFIL